MTTNNKEDVLYRIKEIVEGFFTQDIEEFIPGKTKVRLALPLYDHKEVMQVLESLLSKHLTLNQNISNKIGTFEDSWAKYIGVNNGVMVNSGSSANLLALNVLSNPLVKNHITVGDEIITPALTWSTTISPIFNIHATPTLVDNTALDDFTIDVQQIEAAITDKTKAIMPVHLLGSACDMKTIMEIAEKHNLYVLEDSCEAHGAEFNNKKVGSFGHINTFSFFFSHHFTTIEGGMVMTDNDEFAEIARTLRSQGVMRNTRDKEREKKYIEEYKDIDPAYLFTNLGFNLRPTELQGGFGIEQLKKFPEYLKRRQDNCQFYLKEFEQYSDHLISPKIKPNTTHSWFAYPIIIKPGVSFTTEEFRTFLEEKQIETRPIMSGNYTKHPLNKLFHSKLHGQLTNTETIHNNAFFFGNHGGIEKPQREYIAQCFEEFFKNKK